MCFMGVLLLFVPVKAQSRMKKHQTNMCFKYVFLILARKVVIPQVACTVCCEKGGSVAFYRITQKSYTLMQVITSVKSFPDLLHA